MPQSLPGKEAPEAITRLSGSMESELPWTSAAL